jgi:DeoR/GlpR family transcriptional regulator of sugar metabolism
MLPEQRLDSILQAVQEKGYATIDELVELTGTSESTVRRDLKDLVATGQVRFTRGGAVYVGTALSGFEERTSSASLEKTKVGKAAAELIDPEETILLDGGTTTLEVARHLNGKPVRVVTNSLPVVNQLAGSPNIDLTFLGGYIYPKTGVALGDLTIEALKRVRARKLVMSVGGINEEGLFNSNLLLVATERQMIEAADEVVVVADSQKFGRSELAHLCPLDVVDTVVVDDGLTDEWRKTLKRNGIEIVIAD